MGRAGKDSRKAHRARASLLYVLVGLFVLQSLVAAGLIGYVSLRNARSAVNEVARRLRSEVTTRIEERLRQFLATPHDLNEANAELLRVGALDAEDPEALIRHFWQQVLVTPSVSSVYFGNARGGIADAGREGPGGAFYGILTDGFAAGTFRKFALDEHGGRAAELQSVPNFDARTRGWYDRAVENRGPAWSPIYLLFSGQDMAISASRPAYDRSGAFLGIVSSDIFLSQVGDFLRSLKIGTTGQAFIMERSGLLVAAAADRSPISFGVPGETARRLTASESSSPVVRAAASTVLAEGAPLDAQGTQIELKVEGDKHFLQVSSLADTYGIDWLVVVTVPERDFMARVDESTRLTLGLIVAAVAVATGLGILAARPVTRPLRGLGQAAEALAQGEWREVETRSRIADIASLSGAFNSMTQQLEEKVRDLRASEARYKLLADNSSDVIWTLDLDGRFTYVSPSVEKLRGYTPNEVLGQPFSAALTPSSEAAVTPLLAELRDRLSRGQEPPPEGHHELEQPCKDGTTVWTETVTSPLLDEDGKLIGILGVSRNITARKFAEQERLALEAKLRHSQKLESIGTLASGIAHEVNNPLTGMINYAELIECRVGDSQLREFAQGIQEEGKRVAEIVRGLLSFARQDSSERRAASVRDILRASLTLIGAALRRDDIFLQEDVPDDLPAVICNPQQVQQILINLLTNARDALNRRYLGRDENKRVLVAARAFAQGGRAWVRITVEDRGTGVAADLRTRIFDPFFTTKPRDMGTGLGLSISYGIAREHGGNLTVESDEGRTRFHLDLPAG